MATKRQSEHGSQRTGRQGGGPGAGAGAKEAGGHQPAEPVAAAPTAAAQLESDRTEELGTRLEEANSRYLRLAADFENYKKRSRQEQMDTIQHASAGLAERLLPVADDLQMVLDHAPAGADENWLKGLRLTLQKLEGILAGVGVTPFEARGERFDPNFHEAVGSEESSELPEDTVIVELRRGYRIHDRVLRPAMVKLARPPA